MGVDLMCVGGCSFNWTSWQALYDLGQAFGWKPAGTLVPSVEQGPPPAEDKLLGTAFRYSFGLGPGPDPDKSPVSFSYAYPDENDKETPRGGYFSNDYCWVTEADAKAWCAALWRALDAMEGRAPMTLEEAEAVRRVWAEENGDKTPMSAVDVAIGKALADPDNELSKLTASFEEEMGPPTPEQLKAHAQLMADIRAADANPDLEGLIREFVDKVGPRHGFAIG